MPSPRQVYVAVIGPGGVGTAFLAQLEALAHRYLSSPVAPAHLSLVYVARSSKAILSEFHNPIPFSSWKDSLDKSNTPPLTFQQLADYLSTAPTGGRSILVDNTSSQPLAEAYPLFLRKGISVVTPNKKAFSSSLGLWDEIFAAAANGAAGSASGAGYVFHESTVGAGLPLLSSLRELLDTGDVVTRIEGVFSGTMSFLFNNFMPLRGSSGPAKKFSAEVENAKNLGYTEPDPRDDLNGLDVARKLTILGRIAGLSLESPTSFPVQSLIPKELEGAKSADEFMAGLSKYDDRVEQIKAEAEKEGKVLRYVGSVDIAKGTAEVGLKSFDASHPIAGLTGSDNIVNFYTKRYSASPLTIQGAGAGGDLTAMGVTGDFIKILRLL